MSRLYLYGSSYEEDSIEILALFTRYAGIKQGEDDKKKGFEFLTLLDDGSCVGYVANEAIMGEYGLDERGLATVAQDFLNGAHANNDELEVSDFYLDDNGYVDVRPRYIKNLNKANNRNSRRYLLVEFNGNIYFTDILGLNNGTLYLKADREKNKKGLQWQNYLSLLEYGAIYA